MNSYIALILGRTYEAKTQAHCPPFGLEIMQQQTQPPCAGPQCMELKIYFNFDIWTWCR